MVEIERTRQGVRIWDAVDRICRGKWGTCWAAGLLLLVSGCMGTVLLLLAYGPKSSAVFWGYLSSGTLIALNVLPVICLAFLFYGVFGRAWLGFLLGGSVSLGLSLVNFYKLTFRDDPLYFADLLLIREAKSMISGDHYQLFWDIKIVLVVLYLATGTVALAVLTRKAVCKWRGRCVLLLAVGLAVCTACPVYMNQKLYDSISNFEYLEQSVEQWSPTQLYLSRGFSYPFIHSIKSTITEPPEQYSEKKARSLLEQYQDSDIPEEKMVNVIVLMREAYIDFSEFDIPGLDCSGYELYHQLEEESCSGTLLTNIFTGGTVDSERCFLSGEYMLKDFRSNTNSYVWYLRQQGYTVEGSHPFYRWFYNRININKYLGFEQYRFFEGDYENFSDSFYPEDRYLFPEVYRDFTENKETGKPYFSFNVNVQSHGPYDTDSYFGETEYLTGDYSAECKNAINNYMNVIMDCDMELFSFVEQLRAESEPVVLLVYSDHMPWMGDGNAFYEEMGVNLDRSTRGGFWNYYTTRYLIWANDAAKEVLDNSFTGDAPTVSPCFLMNVLFDQCGWDGPAFMQAMDAFMEVSPVVTTGGNFLIDGQVTSQLPEENAQDFQEFLWLQYYWQNHFLYQLNS